MCKIFFVASLLTFSCVIHTESSLLYNFDNSEKELGDICYLKNNQRGSCEEIMKCEHVKELFRLKKTSEIVSCRFVGKKPLVCCPELEKPSKFEQALCKDKLSPVKFQLNVVNSRKANIGEFPFNAVLGYKSDDGKKLEFDCGGSLIADDILLTAAQCVNKKDRLPIMVRLGRTSLNLNDSYDDIPAQDIDIESIKIHPDYDSTTTKNDIAIIKLKNPANLTEFVDTICLSSNDDIFPKEFTIVGFGRISSYKREKSNWLLKGTVHEEPFDKCKNLLSTIGKEIFDSQICAINDSGIDTGLGDLGCAMSYNENSLSYLYGITSYRNRSGSSYPVVYTKVNKFLDWIEKEMTLLE